MHPSGTFLEFGTAELEHSLSARFEQQARTHAERLAVKTNRRAVTYGALNAAANRVAHAIVARRGQGAESIALLCEQGLAAIIAILGILKAGKTYVPLDVAFPRARTTYMWNDSEAALLVTTTRYLGLARAPTSQEQQVLDLEVLAADTPTEDLGLAVPPDTPAYLLYTSGSTGEPKGVLDNHRNVLHHVRRHVNDLHICPDDRLTLLTSHSFHGAVKQLYGALLTGATLLPYNLAEEGMAHLPPWLAREDITIYHSSPTLFRQLGGALTGAETLPHLRAIVLGGEPAYKSDVEVYRAATAPNCILLNTCGATETGVICHYFVDHETPLSDNVLPLGYALSDIEILLLDEAGRDVGCNLTGEIVVESRYLTMGYWRRPDLTRTAFSSDGARADARRYRTGDLGLMRQDGCLLPRGRTDLQVKVRGHRVEVAEIETALLGHAAVKQAVVMGREDGSGGTRLVAYVVPVGGASPTVSELQGLLRQTVPEYMLPSAFVFVDAVPLTPTGKVDRAALPGPGGARPDLDAPFTAPSTPVEAQLARIWADVLSLEQVGIHDHFLDLGGHSLLATRIASRVWDTFRVDVPLRALLEAPTVAEMATVIGQCQSRQLAPRPDDRP